MDILVMFSHQKSAQKDVWMVAVTRISDRCLTKSQLYTSPLAARCSEYALQTTERKRMS